VVQPLNNTIRENQKNALIAYLLVQPVLIAQGIQDADGLFKFFLIDVQMSSCLQTSRIKQAISTVQLFVQRCLLGLEWPGSNMLDQYRWEPMQSQPLYVARRNVFLYPENWMVASLRDDKSPFYTNFESKLLQNAVTITTATTAVADYLYSLDSVGRLEACGLYYDAPNNIVHICARTVHSPYMYYYRNVNLSNGTVVWTSWEAVQVDIPSYTVQTPSGATGASGTYVTPVVYYGRLMIFFPQFIKKTQPATIPTTSFASVGNKMSPTSQAPIEYWDITLCYAEYRNGQWTPKQIAKDPVTGAIPTIPSTLPSVDSFQVIPRFTSVVTSIPMSYSTSP
jgi:Neuraminidase-like domain